MTTSPKETKEGPCPLSTHGLFHFLCFTLTHLYPWDRSRLYKVLGWVISKGSPLSVQVQDLLSTFARLQSPSATLSPTDSRDPPLPEFHPITLPSDHLPRHVRRESQVGTPTHPGHGATSSGRRGCRPTSPASRRGDTSTSRNPSASSTRRGRRRPTPCLACRHPPGPPSVSTRHVPLCFSVFLRLPRRSSSLPLCLSVFLCLPPSHWLSSLCLSLVSSVPLLLPPLSFSLSLLSGLLHPPSLSTNDHIECRRVCPDF